MSKSKEELSWSLKECKCVYCKHSLGSYPYYLIKENNHKGKTLGYVCEDCYDDKSVRVKLYY